MLKFRVAVVVLLVQLQFLHSSKIVILPWPEGFSHVKMLDKIGVELEKRGHQVVMLLSTMESHIDKVQLQDIRIYQTPYSKNSFGNTIIPGLVQNAFPSPALMAKSFTILENVCDALLSNNDLFKEFQDADLLIIDNAFVLCGALVGEKMSILRVDVGTWGFMDTVYSEYYKIPTPLSYIPTYPGVSTKMTFLQRTLNYGLTNLVRFVWSTFMNTQFSKLKEKHQIAPGKRYEDLLGDADMLIIPVDWSVEWPRPFLPGVKVVGMIGPEPSSVLPADLEEFVNGAEHGVIIVSFGSLVQKYLDIKYTEVMVKAMSAFPQRVLWSNIGNYTLPAESNIKSLKWLPQNDLLAHPNTKLFVSHCGMGGMNEAVYHGVPVLAVPFYGDQHLSAMKLANAGMAIIFDIRNDLVDTRKFQETARELLQNSSYSQHAKRVSRLAKDRVRTPVEESADWVEFVLRANGTKHLQPEAVNMSWFKHDLLDVKIFLLASLCLLVLFVCKVCQCVWTGCKRCCGAAQNKQKTS